MLQCSDNVGWVSGIKTPWVVINTSDCSTLWQPLLLTSTSKWWFQPVPWRWRHTG